MSDQKNQERHVNLTEAMNLDTAGSESVPIVHQKLTNDLLLKRLVEAIMEKVMENMDDTSSEQDLEENSEQLPEEFWYYARKMIILDALEAHFNQFTESSAIHMAEVLKSHDLYKEHLSSKQRTELLYKVCLDNGVNPVLMNPGRKFRRALDNALDKED